MKEANNNLLNKHHGQKDMLTRVDQESAAAVHNSATTTQNNKTPLKHHISQYVKYRATLLNTSSLNISPENLQERQQLWHSLRGGSETKSVPVVPMPPVASIEGISSVFSLFTIRALLSLHSTKLFTLCWCNPGSLGQSKREIKILFV